MTPRKLPLSVLDYTRSVAGEPDIKLKNLYFEQDPTNTDGGSALLARPCVRLWYTGSGNGPTRQVYSQPGTFSDGLFFVMAQHVRLIDTAGGVVSNLGSLGTTEGAVSIAATDSHCFFADGAALYYYTDNEYARGTLTTTGVVSANETVVIGTQHYKFVTDVTASADGTASTPWLVLLSGTTTDNLARLASAISNNGAAGTDYSIAMIGNDAVRVTSSDATTLKIRSAINGTGGNSIATTETMANASWSATTLAGGGATNFAQITVPDGSGIVSVGVIIGFVICVVAPSVGKNGRFYFIRPGEITIDALDYATAERSPDTALEGKIVGDQVWFPGPSSNEVWSPTGDGDAPFERQQGRLFDQGIWAGTIVQLDDAVFCAGWDGTPYEVTDAPVPIGTPGVIQSIREAITRQRRG